MGCGYAAQLAGVPPGKRVHPGPFEQWPRASESGYFFAAPPSGSAGFSTGLAASAAFDAEPVAAPGTRGAVCAAPASGSTGALRTSDVSTDWPTLTRTANAARMMLSNTNRPASTAVARVRKSAAPRADINPVGLPPMPRPPPSDFCNRITPTSAAAMSAWKTVRKINMLAALQGIWSGIVAHLGARGSNCKAGLAPAWSALQIHVARCTFAALMIAAKLSADRLAPPTSAPATSSACSSASALPALTD